MASRPLTRSDRSRCPHFGNRTLWALALIIATLPGCGPDDGLADVCGTITLHGEPLQDATVEFQPMAKGVSSSSGKTDVNGYYQLMYTLHSVGAVPGKHAVSILTAETCFDETGHEYEREERVPTKYNSETVITRMIEPGRNTFDFDL